MQIHESENLAETVREAIALLEKTKNSFRSRQVAHAGELPAAFLDSYLPPLTMPPAEIPDQPISVRLDDALGARHYAVPSVVVHGGARAPALRVRPDPRSAALADTICGASRGSVEHPKMVTPKLSPRAALLEIVQDPKPAVLDAADQFWRVYPDYEEDEARAHCVGLCGQRSMWFGHGPPHLAPWTRGRNRGP